MKHSTAALSLSEPGLAARGARVDRRASTWSRWSPWSASLSLPLTPPRQAKMPFLDSYNYSLFSIPATYLLGMATHISAVRLAANSCELPNFDNTAPRQCLARIQALADKSAVRPHSLALPLPRPRTRADALSLAGRPPVPPRRGRAAQHLRGPRRLCRSRPRRQLGSPAHLVPQQGRRRLCRVPDRLRRASPLPPLSSSSGACRSRADDARCLQMLYVKTDQEKYTVLRSASWFASASRSCPRSLSLLPALLRAHCTELTRLTCAQARASC